MTACPCCHRPYPKPRAAKATIAADLTPVSLDRPVVDMTGWTDQQIYAECKRTGVREDVRFFLRYSAPMPESYRLEAEQLLRELETRASKPADVKRLNQIKDRVRSLRPWPAPWTIEQIEDQRLAYEAETKIDRLVAFYFKAGRYAMGGNVTYNPYRTDESEAA